MTNALLEIIKSHGDRGAIVPYSRIGDLKADMLALKNEEYHMDWLDRMAKHVTGDGDRFIPADCGFVPRSLISIVMPNPKVMVQFQYRGRPVPCAVPAHYTNWERNNRRALQYLRDYLSPQGFSVAMTITLPQKLLAVHCGLALYGRNNICYNEEFGSYMQIMAYLSNLPCGEGPWVPLGRMKRCDICGACVAACPTGAIDPERRLIDSDRCITYFDELPGEEYPAWIDKDAHNSLFGCTKCQDCCPGNACNRDNVPAGAVFTQEETEALLACTDGAYPDALAAKIDEMGIPPEYGRTGVLPRNLRALLEKA